MKILTVGATGGAGRCVVENAVRAGHEVTVQTTPRQYPF